MKLFIIFHIWICSVVGHQSARSISLDWYPGYTVDIDSTKVIEFPNCMVAMFHCDRCGKYYTRQVPEQRTIIIGTKHKIIN